MTQTLDHLRGADESTGAADIYHQLTGLFVDLAHSVAVTNRTFFRKRKRLFTMRAIRVQNANDLRDHVSCTLYLDAITDASVKPRDLISIMEGCVAYDHTADGYGLQPGDRSQLTSASDLDIYSLKRCLSLFGGEFVRDCPLWAAGDKSKPFLPIQTINFINNAINVIR